MPPTPIHLYKRDLPPSPSPTATASSPPNVALIAGLVTCTTVILFLSLVVVVPMIRRRHQRKAPPPSTVEEFLGKDDTFNQSNPNDIAAILDHLSYLPQNDVSQVKVHTSKRRSFLKRLSSQRPPSIIGSGSSRRYSGQHRLSYRNSEYYEKGDYESQYSVPADMRDPPPLDEYAGYHRNSLAVPASAPAYSHKLTRPLNINKDTQSRRRTRDVTSPESDYGYSDSDDEYVHDRPVYRPHTAAPGRENRQSTVGELLRTRFNRDSTVVRESFSLAAAPKPKHRPPPLSKSSGAVSPAATRSAAPLDSVPEMPNSSIAVGFSLPQPETPAGAVFVSPNDNQQSPEQYRHVPLTPRNVALPRTPGSPLKEVYTATAPRTPLRDVLTPRHQLPFTRRDVNSPF